MSLTGSSLYKWSEDILKFEKSNNNVRTNESVEFLITEGANVCKKLKEIYPTLSWWQIADKFTELKKNTKIYYKGINKLDHIIELSKYRHQDVIDIFGL